MSRWYQMSVKVDDVPRELAGDIEDALLQEWEFEGVDILDGTPPCAFVTVYADGDGALCGGEEEADFSNRIANCVWKAAKQYLAVEVVCTCMENIPCETYCFDEEKYEEFLHKVESALPEHKPEMDTDPLPGKMVAVTYGLRSDLHACESCYGDKLPGILFPSSVDGNDVHPWVQRCDSCKIFASDDRAAEFVAKFFRLEDKLKDGIATEGFSARPYMDISWNEAHELMYVKGKK